MSREYTAHVAVLCGLEILKLISPARFVFMDSDVTWKSNTSEKHLKELALPRLTDVKAKGIQKVLVTGRVDGRRDWIGDFRNMLLDITKIKK